MLCLVTNEISSDPVIAISIGREWGIRTFEIKRIFAKRLPFVEEEARQILDDIPRMFKDVRIAALSPGLFDRPMANWEFAWDAGAKLDESLRLCRSVNASTLVVFGVRKTGKESFQQVVDHFGMVSRKAEAAGIQVAIEPHHGNWVGNAASGAELFRAVSSRFLGLNWDAANCRGAGEEALPGGYAAAKPHIKHIHLKGSIRSAEGTLKTALIGEDNLGWPEVFRQLKADNVEVPLSIETHLKPGYEKTKATVQNVKKLMQEAGLSI